MPFKIIEPKENGFVIKVGGLFGFIYYNHMPWKYNSTYFWHNVAEYLVGKVFSCKIRKLKEAPTSIIITAREQAFRKPELNEPNQYRAIVYRKANYGFF